MSDGRKDRRLEDDFSEKQNRILFEINYLQCFGSAINGGHGTSCYEKRVDVIVVTISSWWGKWCGCFFLAGFCFLLAMGASVRSSVVRRTQSRGLTSSVTDVLKRSLRIRRNLNVPLKKVHYIKKRMWVVMWLWNDISICDFLLWTEIQTENI